MPSQLFCAILTGMLGGIAARLCTGVLFAETVARGIVREATASPFLITWLGWQRKPSVRMNDLV